ncbi:hypothetical protein PDE_04926 [Penicillium oxalicum 114-2]|uniref:Uncharacterized protein n=1 Tax=Penicillium oxalicum (strain 114-2 / CGMCC 5302) TaxID=933388 RepID=S7ZMR6_PENO1|nr:hypothetical protein PDE_04926 [Penicillium oxalicum 114-2]
MAFFQAANFVAFHCPTFVKRFSVTQLKSKLIREAQRLIRVMTPQDASWPPSRSLRRISAPKFFIADLDSSSSSNSTSPDASWTEDESKALIIDTPANARKVSSVFSEMDQSYTGLADGEANEENAGKGKCSSFAYADMIQNYQSEQNTGIRLLVWICDPAAECPIQATSLSWSHLQEDQWDISQQLEGLPTVYLGSNFLPDDLPGIHTSSATAHSYRWTAIFKCPPTQPFNSCRWIGRTAEGVIFLEEISRPERHGYPFMSEITKAIYQRDFDLDGLSMGDRHSRVPDLDWNTVRQGRGASDFERLSPWDSADSSNVSVVRFQYLAAFEI